MTLSQLRAFLTVLDSGSFTHAALELDTAQSAVSYAVAELERELGVKLLERGRFGARPTEVGKEIATSARQMLQLHDAIEQQASLTRGIVKGSLRIATFRSVASKVMPPLIARLRRQYPELTLQLVEMDGNTSGIEQALRQARVEVAFVVSPFPEEFHCWELMRDPYVALLPQGTSKELMSRSELARHPLILYEDESCIIRVRDYLKDVVPSVRPAYEVKEDSTIVSMVSQGLGVAVVPALAIEHLPDDVQVVELEQPPERRIGVAIRAGTLKTPAIRVFLNALNELFPASDLPRLKTPAQVL
jgi:DNA-binding transcriptional LysR family regulator